MDCLEISELKKLMRHPKPSSSKAARQNAQLPAVASHFTNQLLRHRKTLTDQPPGFFYAVMKRYKMANATSPTRRAATMLAKLTLRRHSASGRLVTTIT